MGLPPVPLGWIEQLGDWPLPALGYHDVLLPAFAFLPLPLPVFAFQGTGGRCLRQLIKVSPALLQPGMSVTDMAFQFFCQDLAYI